MRSSAYKVAASLRAFERRWEEGHRAGRLHPWEAAAIRSGSTAAVIRDLEPAFIPGERHVISWSRPRPYYDAEIEQTIQAPSQPAMWVVIGQPIRKARGGWSTPLLEIVDKRDRNRFIRRKPPVMADDAKPDEETAHEQSNYQASALGAVDELQAVDDEALAIFSGEAKVKRVLSDRGDVEGKLAEIKQLPPRRRIVELHKLADDRGVDLRDDLRAFERRIERRLGRAA